jgi:hypothetical protein
MKEPLLTPTTAKAVVLQKVLLESGSPRIETDEGMVCVFCGEAIKPIHGEGNQWRFFCECDRAKDFSVTRDTLLQKLDEDKAVITKLDAEAKEAALNVFKSTFQRDVEKKIAILKANVETVTELKSLEEVSGC